MPKKEANNTKENKGTSEEEREGYPNTYYDPDPINILASPQENPEQSIVIHKLGVTMLNNYRDLELEGKELWKELISMSWQDWKDWYINPSWPCDVYPLPKTR